MLIFVNPKNSRHKFFALFKQSIFQEKKLSNINELHFATASRRILLEKNCRVFTMTRS